MNSDYTVRTYQAADRAGVCDLWRKLFPGQEAGTVPEYRISRRLTTQPELFFVAVQNSRVLGTALAGYDGVRGWIYSVAVDPDFQRHGVGRGLMTMAERELLKLGCPKIKLQLLDTNKTAIAFYRALGFSEETTLTMSKFVEPTPPGRRVRKVELGNGWSLSPMRRDDKTNLLRYLNESELFGRFLLTVPHPYSEQDADHWLDKCESSIYSDKTMTYALRDPQDGLCGSCGFCDIVPEHRAEVGYWIARPFWNQGVTTTAVRRLCSLGFSELGLQRITAHVFLGNAASIRVLEKIGFKREGILRKHYKKGDEYLDGLVFSLLRMEATGGSST